MREVVVLRDSAAEARKIREGSVGGQRQNNKNGGNGQVVEKASAKHGRAEHGKKALVAGLARNRRNDAVGFHEKGNARQQDRQQKNNNRQSTLSVFHGGLAEGLDAIADRFYAGQCRATTGK